MMEEYVIVLPAHAADQSISNVCGENGQVSQMSVSFEVVKIVRGETPLLRHR